MQRGNPADAAPHAQEFDGDVKNAAYTHQWHIGGRSIPAVPVA